MYSNSETNIDWGGAEYCVKNSSIYSIMIRIAGVLTIFENDSTVPRMVHASSTIIIKEEAYMPHLMDNCILQET